MIMVIVFFCEARPSRERVLHWLLVLLILQFLALILEETEEAADRCLRRLHYAACLSNQVAESTG